MTIVGTHAGPISGKTHLHLLRESAAARNVRSVMPLPAGPRELIAAAAGDPDFDIEAAVRLQRQEADGAAGEAASGR